MGLLVDSSLLGSHHCGIPERQAAKRPAYSGIKKDMPWNLFTPSWSSSKCFIVSLFIPQLHFTLRCFSFSYQYLHFPISSSIFYHFCWPFWSPSISFCADHLAISIATLCSFSSWPLTAASELSMEACSSWISSPSSPVSLVLVAISPSHLGTVTVPTYTKDSNWSWRRWQNRSYNGNVAWFIELRSTQTFLVGWPMWF